VDVTSWVIAGGVLLIGAGSFHYAAPQRLTRVLSEAMADVERTYLETVENGALSASDVHTPGRHSPGVPSFYFFSGVGVLSVRLGSLQLELLTIRQASLRSSLSHYAMFCDILKGRTFSALRCIHDVSELGTHIEVC
jgi:hypothetical protein